MFLPADYLWLEPVLIATAAVFVISLVGNALAFGSRVVFGVVFGALVYYGYGNVSMSVSTKPSPTAPATK
mgnify:CR=1 FL=1